MNHPNSEQIGSGLAGKLPSSNYWSQEHFRDEIDHVFRRAWLNICREEELPNPGDFMVQELYALGGSALIVRGEDLKLRAFYNMCVHRGNRVELERTGNKRGFRCLFHGWAYDLHGSVVNAPEIEKFSAAEPPETNLVPIHCDSWGGFFHICLASEPPCSLDEFMQPMTNRVGQHLADQSWSRSLKLSVEVGCNWKLPYDAVSEFYHLDHLHPDSIGGVFSMKDSVPVIAPDRVGVVGHFEAFFAEVSRLEPTQIQQITARLGAAGIHTKSDLSDYQTRFPEAINLHNRPDWAADMYVTIPHVAYTFQEQGLAIQRSWPIAVDRCLVDLEIWGLAPLPRNFSEVVNGSSVTARTVDVLAEDFSTLERIQQNLEHGPVRNFSFNTDEGLVKGLQDLIAEWITRGKAATN